MVANMSWACIGHTNRSEYHLSDILQYCSKPCKAHPVGQVLVSKKQKKETSNESEAHQASNFRFDEEFRSIPTSPLLFFFPECVCVCVLQHSFKFITLPSHAWSREVGGKSVLNNSGFNLSIAHDARLEVSGKLLHSFAIGTARWLGGMEYGNGKGIKKRQKSRQKVTSWGAAVSAGLC